MRIAIVLCAILACPVGSARAFFTDFEDLPRSTAYPVGETIHSMGIALEVVPFQVLGNPAQTGGGAGPFGIRLNVGPGVSFQLPSGTTEVSFDYEDGAGLRLAINGVQPAVYPGQAGTLSHAGFSFLDGMSLAGVDVTTTTTESTRVFERGSLTLRGPMDSLVIAGLELLIDNVSVRVPEPLAAQMLIIGVGVLLNVRCRRRQGRLPLSSVLLP